MSQDIHSQAVKNALIKDGWTITDDPLTLSYGGKDVYVDLGAERTIAAEKDGNKIAVEIKSFLGKSDVKELRDAIGQYVMYRDILMEINPERILYLAVSETIFKSIFDAPFGHFFLNRERINLIVFDPNEEVIKKWILH